MRPRRTWPDKLDWIQAHYEKLVPGEPADRYNTTHRSRYLVGTDQIVEKLSAVRDLGLAYAITNSSTWPYSQSGALLFADTVIPEFA